MAAGAGKAVYRVINKVTLTCVMSKPLTLAVSCESGRHPSTSMAEVEAEAEVEAWLLLQPSAKISRSPRSWWNLAACVEKGRAGWRQRRV